MKQTRLLDGDHSKELFAYFGLAVYYSQALEQQLANLLMLIKLSQGNVPSEEDFTELYQRKLSSSLGQLVHEIQHYFPFSEEETLQLKKYGSSETISFMIISKNGSMRRLARPAVPE